MWGRDQAVRPLTLAPNAAIPGLEDSNVITMGEALKVHYLEIPRQGANQLNESRPPPPMGVSQVRILY